MGDTNTTLTSTFKPGALGLGLDHVTGRVRNVRQGGQADLLGVKAGMHLLLVENDAYTEALLAQKANGTGEFNVTFRSAASPTLTMVFKPGSLGLAIDQATGMVKTVRKDAQAHLLGVTAGMSVLSIDNEVYTETLLDSKIG